MRTGVGLGSRAPVHHAVRYIGRQFLTWFAVFFRPVVHHFSPTRSAAAPRGVQAQTCRSARLLEMALFKLPHTAEALTPFAILFSGMMAFGA